MPTLRKPPGLGSRERRPGERRPLTPGTRPTSAVWYVLGFLLLMAVAQAWFLKAPGRSVSYSEFKQSLRTDQIEDVVVGDQNIHGNLKRDVDGTKAFTTTRIEDPKLVEELDGHNVKYTGEVVNRWLMETLGWVLPLLVL